MASALSPDINSHEVNLGVATKLMTETYLQALSEMSRSELRNFDKHTIQAQLETHMWELMGNNVQRTAMELECERMCAPYTLRYIGYSRISQVKPDPLEGAYQLCSRHHSMPSSVDCQQRHVDIACWNPSLPAWSP